MSVGIPEAESSTAGGSTGGALAAGGGAPAAPFANALPAAAKLRLLLYHRTCQQWRVRKPNTSILHWIAATTLSDETTLTTTMTRNKIQPQDPKSDPCLGTKTDSSAFAPGGGASSSPEAGRLAGATMRPPPQQSAVSAAPNSKATPRFPWESDVPVAEVAKNQVLSTPTKQVQTPAAADGGGMVVAPKRGGLLLNLSRDYLGPRGMCAVLSFASQISALQTINVSHMRIFTAGMRHASTAIPGLVVLSHMYTCFQKHTGLVELILDDNELTTAAYLWLVKLCRDVPFLMTVSLNGTLLSDAQKEHLAAILKRKEVRIRKRIAECTTAAPPSTAQTDGSTMDASVPSRAGNSAAGGASTGTRLVMLPSLLDVVSLRRFAEAPTSSVHELADAARRVFQNMPERGGGGEGGGLASPPMTPASTVATATSHQMNAAASSAPVSGYVQSRAVQQLSSPDQGLSDAMLTRTLICVADPASLVAMAALTPTPLGVPGLLGSGGALLGKGMIQATLLKPRTKTAAEVAALTLLFQRNPVLSLLLYGGSVGPRGASSVSVPPTPTAQDTMSSTRATTTEMTEPVRAALIAAIIPAAYSTEGTFILEAGDQVDHALLVESGIVSCHRSTTTAASGSNAVVALYASMSLPAVSDEVVSFHGPGALVGDDELLGHLGITGTAVAAPTTAVSPTKGAVNGTPGTLVPPSAAPSLAAIPQSVHDLVRKVSVRVAQRASLAAPPPAPTSPRNRSKMQLAAAANPNAGQYSGAALGDGMGVSPTGTTSNAVRGWLFPKCLLYQHAGLIVSHHRRHWRKFVELLPCLHGMGTLAKQAVIDCLRERTFGFHDVIVAGPDMTKEIFFVVEGTVRVFFQRTELRTLARGDVFACLPGPDVPRSGVVSASRATVLAVIPELLFPSLPFHVQQHLMLQARMYGMSSGGGTMDES